MRQGDFDTLRKKLSQVLRSHDLVTQLTAETRVAVERHPHVMQMMHVGTESALLTHGVLGPPELATRAHINARLFGSPAYADLREFIRRLLSAHDVAADVMAAIDRAAQAAIDAANGVAPVADSTASLGAAVPTPAADVPAVPGGADATAKTQTQLVHALLARKPVARPLAKPSVRAVALASRAKVVTKTTIILPYDAIMIGRRLIQAAERGDASSEDFDSDDDDDSASSSEAPAAQSAPSTVMAPTAEADDGTTPAAAATTAATTHKFSCETCGKGFRRKRDMSSHMVNQHGAEPTSDLHVCTDCPMAFAYPNKLASHRQAKHGAAPPEPTTKVDEPAEDGELADEAPPPSGEQEARKTKRKRRRAEAAAAAAAAAAADAAAAAANDDVIGDDGVGVTAEGDEMAATTVETPAAVEVAPIVKSKPFACEQCDERFDRKSRLDRHIAAEHAPPPVEAEAQPDEAQAAADALALAAAKKKYVCSQCEMRFDRQSRLDKHVTQAHAPVVEAGEAPDVDAAAVAAPPSDMYACEHCEQQFKRKSALDRHVGQAHAVPTTAATEDGASVAATDDQPVAPTTTGDAKKWVCDQCTAAFDRKGKLASHKSSIHGGKSAAAPTPKRRRAVDEAEEGEADAVPPTPAVGDIDDNAAAGDNGAAGDDAAVEEDAVAATTTTPGRSSDGKKWACEHCDARFDRKGKLDSHVSARHADVSAPSKRRRGGEAEEGETDQ